MLRMYIIAAVVVAVGGALLGARAYYKDTQERIATLHKNNAKMEVVQKQNEWLEEQQKQAAENSAIDYLPPSDDDEDEDYQSEEEMKLDKFGNYIVDDVEEGVEEGVEGGAAMTLGLVALGAESTGMWSSLTSSTMYWFTEAHASAPRFSTFPFRSLADLTRPPT